MKVLRLRQQEYSTWKVLFLRERKRAGPGDLRRTSLIRCQTRSRARGNDCRAAVGNLLSRRFVVHAKTCRRSMACVKKGDTSATSISDSDITPGRACSYVIQTVEMHV